MQKQASTFSIGKIAVILQVSARGQTQTAGFL